MIPMNFGSRDRSIHKVLCLGAHSDDIEIGCGGAILKLIAEQRELLFHWVVFSGSEQRAQEAHESAALFLQGAREKNVVVKRFRDGYFPYVAVEIKEYFEQIKHDFSPDLIFTHSRNDLHQDHRLISELTWNTFRDHLILEYEIPKYDGDLGAPNLFVHLEQSHCSKKIEYIVKTFATQSDNHWFTEDLFRSILRIRGVESNAPAGFAEGFYCRKMVF